jgi:hypothetical protein
MKAVAATRDANACPLCPQKQTSQTSSVVSAQGQKRKSHSLIRTASRRGRQQWWHLQAEAPGRFEIDGEFLASCHRKSMVMSNLRESSVERPMLTSVLESVALVI